MTGRQPSGSNLWLTFGAVLWVLAWLLPDKSGPWRSFASEWLAAVAMLPLALWLGLRRGQIALPIPAVALAIIAGATIPLAQFFLGQVSFVGDALLAAMYLAGAGFAIVAGRAWRKTTPESASVGMPLTALLAAIFTFGLGLMQWLQLDGLGVMLVALPAHARPTGNIGQANHFGSLMALGLIAAWWLYERRRIGGAVATTTALILLLGLAMSQSRTGWVSFSVLALAALALRPRLGLRLPGWAVLSLSLVFAAMVVGWGRANTIVELNAALTLSEQLAPGPRLAIWQQFFQAALSAPWLGYGWTQGGLAQQAVLLDMPPINIVLGHAHNLILDLLVWQGAPLTAAMLFAAAAWIWKRAGRLHSLEAVMSAMALVIMIGHSMLEFPLHYTYFLLPAALLIGVIEADADLTPSCVVSRPTWLFSVVVAAGLTTWIGMEYLTIRESFDRYRFEAARVGTQRGSLAPDIKLLTQLGALMSFVRTPADAHLNTGQLRAAERVVARFPSGGNQFRLASILTHSGQPVHAALVLRQLCAQQREPNCELARSAWAAQSETDDAMRDVRFPAAAVRR